MAILDFQKPDKVPMNHSDEFKGEFEFRPLEPGTVLLSEILLEEFYYPLLKVLQLLIKIQGVDHEFNDN